MTDSLAAECEQVLVVKDPASSAEAIVAALDAERRALEPEVAQAAAECEAAAERTSTTK